MDRDRIEGTGRQVAGALKEAVGRLVGNRRLEAEGAAEKNAGEVQNTVGKAKVEVRDALD